MGLPAEKLPGPAVPPEADIVRNIGAEATLETGNSVTVLSGESGIPPEDSVYEAREGMEFFVIEAEVCVPESGRRNRLISRPGSLACRPRTTFAGWRAFRRNCPPLGGPA